MPLYILLYHYNLMIHTTLWCHCTTKNHYIILHTTCIIVALVALVVLSPLCKPCGPLSSTFATSLVILTPPGFLNMAKKSPKSTQYESLKKRTSTFVKECVSHHHEAEYNKIFRWKSLYDQPLYFPPGTQRACWRRVIRQQGTMLQQMYYSRI